MDKESKVKKAVGRPRKKCASEGGKTISNKLKIQKNNYEAKNRDIRNQRRRENYSGKLGQKKKRGYSLHETEKVEALDIGDLVQKCQFCQGLTFKNEQGRSRNSCCHRGKIMISATVYPSTLKNLLYGMNDVSSHFRQNIRVYNNAFAFASFNCTNEDIRGKGPYSMRIIGEARRKVTTSLFSIRNPRYGQVYIYDDNETVQLRKQENTREDILLLLQELLKSNPYATKYRELHKVYTETNESTVSLNFLKFKGSDSGRYNAPIGNQIAAIITTLDGAIPMDIDVKVFPKNSIECDYISATSHHCDPMLFPLLFPNGEIGWSYCMKTELLKNISPLQFYSYKLTVREEFNPVLVFGRLTQQYVINAYLTVESQRLKFFKLNQSHLRTECYQGLVDHVRNYAANMIETRNIGNILILPSTFQGSARCMQQLYHDAMAICRKIGRPDLFITMTCNPAWPEIRRYLKTLPANTTANDIPYFTTRLFYQKALNLINELPNIFGDLQAYVYTIEFQKRGLPHMHLLVTLKKKLLSADDVDKYISAEIPEKDTFPSLHYKVIKHMLHGPHLPGLPCYTENAHTCTKKFPKHFIDETDMSSTGFPKYKRRDNKHEMNTYHGKHNGKIMFVDNSMVVPYNAYLLMKYDCHLNVEYCASIMGVKYIHKYIHKGHDKAKIKISHDGDSVYGITDEIQNFVDSRYLSATESAWRLFELPLHGRSHAVERLPIHLPGMNRVVFVEGKETEAIEKNHNTKLTAYFELNKNDNFAKSLKYEVIPSAYRWINEKKKWQRRIYTNSKIVSRLIAVSSKSVELFHLKLLLRHVVAATSFDDLKTVNNYLHKTFQEAAKALGLVSSDSEMTEVMQEASSVLMPKQLRHFFVYILLGSESVNAAYLWSNFKTYLTEDTTEDSALLQINKLLEDENSSLEAFGLLKPDTVFEHKSEVLDISSHRKEYFKMRQSLNEQQEHAFLAIEKAINTSQTGNCFYIDGPGGSGKTYLYRCIFHYALSKSLRVFTIAWTGIAAILLPHGRTAHKTFQLPINIDEITTLYWNSRTKEVILNSDIFIWDEASMIPAAALESIDAALKDICSSTKPFGGKIFLLGGDFRQVLPVIKRAGRHQTINATIKRSFLWDHFKCFCLTENMRSSDSTSSFSQWLLTIGNGSISSLTVSDDFYSFDIVEDMYRGKPLNLYPTQAILTPRNDDVSLLNSKILNELPGETIHCLGVDYVTSRGTDNADEAAELFYPLEYINTLTPSGFPPFYLQLKIGAIVMLIRNICISDGLCNGTRLIIRSVKQRLLYCEILTGDKKGNMVYIPKIKLDSSSDTELPFVLHRTQFPVRLAFAMTINKSQGQTFERIGLYINDEHPIFSHGQLYVALSRCKSYEGIKIQLSKENTTRQICNIVYQEIL